MAPGWRNGFGFGGSWVWAAPIAPFALVAIGQATNVDGDLRSGVFPWFMATAAVGLALAGVRLIALHGPEVPVVARRYVGTQAFLADTKSAGA